MRIQRHLGTRTINRQPEYSQPTRAKMRVSIVFETRILFQTDRYFLLNHRLKDKKRPIHAEFP
jgi:hypothetical protein